MFYFCICLSGEKKNFSLQWVLPYKQACVSHFGTDKLNLDQRIWVIENIPFIRLNQHFVCSICVWISDKNSIIHDAEKGANRRTANQSTAMWPKQMKDSIISTLTKDKENCEREKKTKIVQSECWNRLNAKSQWQPELVC